MKNILEILESYDWSMIEDRMQFVLDGVVEKEAKQSYGADYLNFCLSCMDYTSLRITDTKQSVENFIQDLLKKQKKANLNPVAAVCVFPQYASVVRKALAETTIKTTAVAGGFPTAQTFLDLKIKECQLAMEDGAEEIDIVLSVGDVLEKNYEKVYAELLAIREACRGVTLKVILETGELKSMESIFNASLISMYAGADFIKTSTGKVPVNATPEVVYIMCEAIKQYYERTNIRVGIKVAGGVAKASNALRYLSIVNYVLGKEWMSPTYFRLGASLLLDDIYKEIKNFQLLEEREKAD